MTAWKRICRLLRPDERTKAGRMACTAFLQALLDFVGLATLLPLLYYLLEDGGNRRAALLFSLLALLVIAVKSLLTVRIVRYQDSCLLAFYRRLSFSLFSAYYRRGLLFIREQGSVKLAHEVNAVCYAFSHSLLAPLCRMAGDLLLLLLVTAGLIVFDGATVLILYASFLPFVGVYVFGVRGRVRRYGREDMHAKREQARVVTDALRGYAELEVNGAFPAWQDTFLEGLQRISSVRLKLDTLLRLPLFLSELSVVIGLGLLAALGHGDVKLVVGVFAVAAFRLLPAMRGLLAGWTQVQNALCCIDIIEEGLADSEETAVEESGAVTFNSEIAVEQLCYTYPDGAEVLKDFGCRIRKGEYVGFRGFSGAGKSTLFHLLTGLLRPTSGAVRIDGKPLADGNRAAWLRHVGYVPQEVFVFNGTLAENVALDGKKPDEQRVERVLRQVCLDRWVETLPEGLHTRLGEGGGKVSGGQKQRIGLARALYKDADVLLLDEATSALDNRTEREVNETLHRLRESREGLTILSIAHRESSLAYCDRVITLKNDNENA